jgi:hypothetical protein
MLELKVRQFSDTFIPRLKAQGLDIQSQHAMSLEEIFVSTVRDAGAA